MSKRYDEGVEVELGEGPGSWAPQPRSFVWRGRRYPVDRLIKYWREAGQAWDSDIARDHEFYRVEAKGGVYDLCRDRLVGKGARRSQGEAEGEAIGGGSRFAGHATSTIDPRNRPLNGQGRAARPRSLNGDGPPESEWKLKRVWD